MSVNVNGFSERKEATIGADILRHARRRVSAATEQLSRKGAALASAEICNEATCKLIDLCFELDTDGQPCNIDANGRLLIPAPWGRAGRYQYGLRSTEGDVLRLHLYKLMELRQPAPLFTYDATTRSWYLNRWDYGSKTQALNYWRQCQLDASTYKTLVEMVQNR